MINYYWVLRMIDSFWNGHNNNNLLHIILLTNEVAVHEWVSKKVGVIQYCFFTKWEFCFYRRFEGRYIQTWNWGGGGGVNTCCSLALLFRVGFYNAETLFFYPPCTKYLVFNSMEATSTNDLGLFFFSIRKWRGRGERGEKVWSSLRNLS